MFIEEMYQKRDFFSQHSEVTSRNTAGRSIESSSSMNGGFLPNASLTSMNVPLCKHHKKCQKTPRLTFPGEKIKCFGPHKMTKLYSKTKA